jgi:hypothetical protein
VLLAPAAARADRHNFDVLLAGSGSTGSFLKGFHASLAVPFPNGKDWSVPFDFSRHTGESDGIDVTRRTWTIGFRHMFPGQKVKNAKGAYVGVRKRLPFAHTFVGKLHTGDGVSHLVAGLGGGMDWILKEGRTEWGIRGQADLIVPHTSDVDAYGRFSVGVIFRLEPKP